MSKKRVGNLQGVGEDGMDLTSHLLASSSRENEPVKPPVSHTCSSLDDRGHHDLQGHFNTEKGTKLQLSPPLGASGQRVGKFHVTL